ncbi:hypothetical protein C8J31_107144 [Rhizobium sp. PP-CC-2G-626]|nr:hypothetical protein C8J31_107144 [Rhizobium sp. PP-CC-2G-626]
MKSREISSGTTDRMFVLILEKDEEAFAAITQFASENAISGASITAIGAFSEATIAWFDMAEKSYVNTDVSEQSEVLSLIGDVAEGDDGKPSLHLHAVLGLRDCTTRGGHFVSGIVDPTLEVILTETPAVLRRRKQPGMGFALIDPNAA